MAPLITTSLREYAIDKVRECERRPYARSVQERDEWLALQDWTESTDATQPFDDLIDEAGAAMEGLEKYIEKHDIGDAENHPLNDLYDRLAYIEGQANDCRYIITNQEREDAVLANLPKPVSMKKGRKR